MKENKAISFQQMCPGRGEFEADEVPYFNPPLINSYEEKIPGEGFNQSGFTKTKKGY